MLYFHFCDNYKNSTEPEIDVNLRKNLKEFSSRDSLKGIGKISSFTKGIFVLKMKNPYSEIILEERKIKIDEENVTVYFIRGFKTSLQDYVEIRDGKWLDYNQLGDDELNLFLEKFKENISENEQSKLPPKELTNWQLNYKLKVNYDIFESESWVKFSSDPTEHFGMKLDEVKLFGLTLNEIISKDKYIELTNKIYYNVKDNCGIIFSILKFDEKKLYYLIDGANVITQKDKWEKLINENFSFIKEIETYSNLTRQSLKAYPSWVLKDLDVWSKIQLNNILGNLSLLPEQTEFLKDFKFPKYINGQAGSGKSTMMYYLFANIYYYKCAGEIPGDIIFLTENPKLLDHTKNAVTQLLINNPEFDLSSEYESIMTLKDSFFPFKEFLLSLLPENFDFENNFNSNKYLNFSKFKTLYEQSKLPSHIINKYSPELVWFMITTYVYGNDINYNITSENYDLKMPREGKEIISNQNFRDIEQQVINPFYNKLLEEGYWDRIQLIRYLIKNIKINKSFDVIFCDEAQDFSKVELEFILKLSTYTKYNLSEVEQFPIVFAGDALQTVNPTGFRSEVLTSMIYEKLTNVEMGYKLDSSKLVFTPIFNYRSSQSIVDVANAIQYYRKTHLRAEVKNPQVSKKPTLYENENLNVFVTIEDFSSDYNLQKKVLYKNIIVPVNNDEIEKYKIDFPVLEKFDNIISSVDAKGLDFDQVVIFGFGEYFKNNISNLKENIYESRFFYNKLYVGVTRAQSELIIIDSADSKESFWVPLINEYVKSDWITNNYTVPNSFEKIIIFDTKEIIGGTPETLLYDAKRQFDQGFLEKNKSLLQIASSHFLRLKENRMYRKCLAIIAEIDGNWKRAGELYLYNENGKNTTENEEYESAINAYWKGKLWENLLLIINKIQSEENRIKNIIANFYINNKIPIHQLTTIYDDLVLFKKIIKNLDWKKTLIEDLHNYLINLTNEEENSILSDILFEITSNKYPDILIKIAEIYFNNNRFQNVIDVFDKLDNHENELFFKSKLEIAKRKNDFEEIIIWNGRLALNFTNLREHVANEIYNTYYSNIQELNSSKNIYIKLYSYFSSLFKDDLSEKSLTLANATESIFCDRKNELSEHYLNLLNNAKLSLNVQNFLIERWVRNVDLNLQSIDKINSIYEELSKKINLTYHPFTISEINKIPRVINSFEILQSQHFTNFEILNFKKFESLEVKNIGLINIIVGDNNVGKTSLLEALSFTKDKETYLKRLIYLHIIRSNIYPDKLEISTDNIIYKYKLERSFLNQFKKYQDKNIVFKLKNGRVFSIFNLSFVDYVEKNSNDINLLYNNSINLENILYEIIINQPFIPYGKGFGLDLAKSYDKYIRVNREIEKEFLENLKVFIPSVESVYVSSNGNIEIRELNSNEDRPLYQYGEGANKLFRILVLLSTYKGEILLIDEIDSGIHYSRFKEFWRTIIKIAVNQNTQIFATTHNEECIKYFTEVLNEEDFGLEYQEKSRVIQLKNLDKLISRTFDFSSFNLAYDDKIEIRG
jgi:AAA15 family ATPase/GTPase